MHMSPRVLQEKVAHVDEHRLVDRIVAEVLIGFANGEQGQNHLTIKWACGQSFQYPAVACLSLNHVHIIDLPSCLISSTLPT